VEFPIYSFFKLINLKKPAQLLFSDFQGSVLQVHYANLSRKFWWNVT